MIVNIKMGQRPSYLQEVLGRKPYRKKQILDFINRFTVIEDVLVDNEIFNYTFKCAQPGCGICCFAGTLVTKEEINRISNRVDDIKPYLSESKIKRLNKLDNQFYTIYYVEGFFKLRTWNSSCIFLMEDKRCAVHTFCLDNGVDWIKFHFDLCVTYPLRINRNRKIMHIEEELYNKEYVYPCFNKKEDDGKKNEGSDLLYYMKNVIVDRFGLGFWEAMENRYKR